MVRQEQNQTTRFIQKKQGRVQTDVDTAGTHLSVNKLVNQVN